MFSFKSLLDKVTLVQSELTEKLNTSPGWERETPDFPEDVDISTGQSGNFPNNMQIVRLVKFPPQEGCSDPTITGGREFNIIL